MNIIYSNAVGGSICKNYYLHNVGQNKIRSSAHEIDAT